MEHKLRLGRPMSLDEVAELLGWSEAEQSEHRRALDGRPAPDLDEARARIAAHTQ